MNAPSDWVGYRICGHRKLKWEFRFDHRAIRPSHFGLWISRKYSTFALHTASSLERGFRLTAPPACSAEETFFSALRDTFPRHLRSLTCSRPLRIPVRQEPTHVTVRDCGLRSEERRVGK